MGHLKVKLLSIQRNNLIYEFRLLEACNVIEVSKGKVFTYTITKPGKYFRCTCPGSRYHGKCWHLEMVRSLMSQGSVDEPWTEWAEEAGVMQYRKEVR